MRVPLVAALALIACGRPAEAPKKNGPVAKIIIPATGEIFIDDEPHTLAQAEPRLKDLKAKGGAVWLYAQSGDRGPSPVSIKVIKLAVDDGLDVSLSSKPDFSDEVGADGKTKPRTP